MMKVDVLYLFGVAAGILRADAGRAPEIKTTGSSLKAVPGKKVYMPCEARGDPRPSITWERGRRPVNLLGNRFSVNTETQALRIFHVKVEDGGNYTCIAKNPFGMEMITITLLVMIQPECKITSPTNFTLLELTNQEIVCRSRGFPKPSFEWLTSNNQRIRPMTSDSANITSSRRLYSLEREIGETMFESVLFFQPMTFIDSGSLVCVAYNEIGSGRDTVILDVRFSPKVISTYAFPQVVSLWEGHNVSLTCVVAGNDLPEITWAQSGQPYHCATLEEWVQGTEIKSTCTLKHSADEGSGVYTCSAQNRLGKILAHEFHINEIFRPDQVKFRPARLKPDAIVLYVKVLAKDSSPMAIYVLALYRLLPGNSSDELYREYESTGDVNKQGDATVTLLGIFKGRDYLVKVKAWNIVGFGPDASAVLNTNTLPDVSSIPSASTECPTQIEKNTEIAVSTEPVKTSSGHYNVVTAADYTVENYAEHSLEDDADGNTSSDEREMALQTDNKTFMLNAGQVSWLHKPWLSLLLFVICGLGYL